VFNSFLTAALAGSFVRLGNNLKLVKSGASPWLLFPLPEPWPGHNGTVSATRDPGPSILHCHSLAGGEVDVRGGYRSHNHVAVSLIADLEQRQFFIGKNRQRQSGQTKKEDIDAHDLI